MQRKSLTPSPTGNPLEPREHDVLLSGGLIIGKIFTSEIWGAYFQDILFLEELIIGILWYVNSQLATCNSAVATRNLQLVPWVYGGFWRPASRLAILAYEGRDFLTETGNRARETSGTQGTELATSQLAEYPVTQKMNSFFSASSLWN